MGNLLRKTFSLISTYDVWRIYIYTPRWYIDIICNLLKYTFLFLFEQFIFVVSILLLYYIYGLFYFLSFLSFLNKTHTWIKIGIVVGVGATMVRESSAVMIGHYFKRRRQFVEMITMSGEGVGIALFSVILKEGVGYVFLAESLNV